MCLIRTPLIFSAKFLFRPKIAQQLTVKKKKVKCKNRYMLAAAFQTWATPSSQPRMTSPRPILNWKGFSRSLEESNFFPSVRVPVQRKGYRCDYIMSSSNARQCGLYMCTQLGFKQTHNSIRSFIESGGGWNEELDQRREFKSATWDNYRPTLQCR